jgi:preprotein translocase subunit YajC
MHCGERIASMLPQLGDKVRVSNGMEGEIVEVDEDGVTALVELSGGMIGRFALTDLERLTPPGNLPFSAN